MIAINFRLQEDLWNPGVMCWSSGQHFLHRETRSLQCSKFSNGRQAIKWSPNLCRRAIYNQNNYGSNKAKTNQICPQSSDVFHSAIRNRLATDWSLHRFIELWLKTIKVLMGINVHVIWHTMFLLFSFVSCTNNYIPEIWDKILMLEFF